MNLLLDTMILGEMCHPRKTISQPVWAWVNAILDVGDDQVILSELCDYEVRRKLLHLINQGQQTHKSIERLDELAAVLEYLPINTPTMRKAAEFWAAARSRGQPTAPEPALDGDVILAAQAALVGGMIVTSNRKHLSQFVPAWDRTEIVWGYAFVCIRGPVDNLAFDWKDHFMVQDTQGRNWHCRQESTWYNQQDAKHSQLVAKLDAVGEEVVDMYQKLFSSGHGTTEGTFVRTPITVCPVPISRTTLLGCLANELGDDSNNPPESND